MTYFKPHVLILLFLITSILVITGITKVYSGYKEASTVCFFKGMDYDMMKGKCV